MGFAEDLLGSLAASGAINLTPAQINAESGGQQFDKSGKPLTSPKGAVGVAQVMESTGPEAAAAAGVPWDRNKWQNDRDYNLQIGDAYQGKLNKQFAGDPIAATAAYNAGPTRVAALKAKFGEQWAQHLPQESKDYVHHIMGVDVDEGGPDGYYPQGNRTTGFIDDIASSLGMDLKDYSVDKPTAGESAPDGSMNSGNFPIASPDSLDTGKIASAVGATQDATDNYSNYLQSAVEPLRQNQAAQTAGFQKVAAVKTGLASDFATREGDLEGKIVPLMAARQKLLDQEQALDSMNPLDRRMKAIFNPAKYDPRVLRGQVERIEDRINGLQGSYEDLNKLRSGVAAASIDATGADVDVLKAAREGTLADLSLMGQVVGATKEQVSAAMLPLNTQVDTMRLTEAAKADYLGKQSLEGVTSLYQQARQSPDGTVNVNGMKLTVGELQGQQRTLQEQDITGRSMVNSFKTQDLQTSDQLETRYISHMTRAQIGDALKNQGQVTINGSPYHLSLPKLTEALQTAQTASDAMVEQAVVNTSAGLAHSVLGHLTQTMQFTRQRAVEMFGNTPGEITAQLQTSSATLNAWTEGLNAANAAGNGKEYIAKTLPTIQGLQTGFDAATDTIAKRWSGGNPGMYAVASAYLHGNPIDGGSAIKGLIQIATSGMPAGAKLTGPAAQAIEAARAIVREWNSPQTGDSLEAIMKGGTKKPADLENLVRDRVSGIYADAVTDAVIKDFPQLARTVRDPNNPGQMHPFARVNPQDFTMAIQHGDAQGFRVVGQQMGVDADTAKAALSGGVDSPEWQAIAKNKGWGSDKYQQIVGALQSIQMSETLSALDASHSAHPGFSPAKAYVDFLQTPEVQNRVDQAVNGYGNSSFGAFLVSSATGGGYRDAWSSYTQAVGNQYFLNHGQELQQRINQQRQITGDPYVRFNAVNQAAGLTKQESQVLLQAVRPLVHLTPQDDPVMSMPDVKDMTGVAAHYNSNNFDAIANVVRNHKFEDPTLEKIRKKVANQWDVSDAIVGTVFKSVSD